MALGHVPAGGRTVRPAGGGLRAALCDPRHPGSLAARARARRAAELLRRFPDLPRMRVLDLGGTPEFWTGAAVRPYAVTTVNLVPAAAAPPPWITHVVGDACVPGTLGDGYDLVVSNSLLEHVGGHARRRMLAEVVHACAPRHWVQTPYRYFPLEPHWLAPGWQFLPPAARAGVLRRWPYSHVRPATRHDALREVLGTELVTGAEMRWLFPGSDIWRERVAGLTKSLVAVR